MVDGLINRPRSRTPPPYIPLQDPECEEHDVHALMYDIASRTESIFAQPTVYDILRLPEYKSWKEHIDNARALAAWLAPGPDQSCICEARRAKILTMITEQFEWISADSKSKYEFDIHSSIHTGDFSVENRPAGDEAWMRAVEYRNPRDLDYDVTDVQVPSFNNYMPQTLRREAYHEIVQYPWRYYFSDVHSIPKIAFQQILPENFCRKRQNTFWLALSLALTGGDRFWAKFKADARHYYHEIKELPDHPRYDAYVALNVEAKRRGTAPIQPTYPIHDLEKQLARDVSFKSTLGPPKPTATEIAAAIVEAKAGKRPLPDAIADVTVELYQLIADVFHIELIVIQDQFVQPSTGKRSYRPWVVRGDHNTRQVFMLQFEDGEYIAVKPANGYAEDVRFTPHMPRHGALNAEDYTARELYLSALVRTPFVQHDRDGLPVVPTRFLPGYTAPDVPDHIKDTPAVVQATDEEILAMMNTGCWR